MFIKRFIKRFIKIFIEAQIQETCLRRNTQDPVIFKKQILQRTGSQMTAEDKSLRHKLVLHLYQQLLIEVFGL